MKVKDLMAVLSGCDPEGEVLLSIPFPDEDCQMGTSREPTISALYSSREKAEGPNFRADRLYIEQPEGIWDNYKWDKNWLRKKLGLVQQASEEIEGNSLGRPIVADMSGVGKAQFSEGCCADQELGYALAKQLPDMTRGFDVLTNYGSLYVSEEDAEVVVRLLEERFEQRLSEQRRSHND